MTGTARYNTLDLKWGFSSVYTKSTLHIKMNTEIIFNTNYTGGQHF